MKKLAEPVNVIEVANEGYFALLGKRITVWNEDGYIDTGLLEGVSDEFIMLSAAAMVFETGPFNDSSWTDAQYYPNAIYIPKSKVARFTILK